MLAAGLSFATALSLPTAARPAAPPPPRPPEVVGPAPSGGLLVAADGAFEQYSLQAEGGRARIMVRRSRDLGRTWSDAVALGEVQGVAEGHSLRCLRDRRGELHGFWGQARGDGRKPAVDRFIDLWHVRSEEQGTRWSAPQRIFTGYVGSFQQVAELSDGTLVLPFARWIGDRPSGPPTGSNVTTTVTSKDEGRTWQLSPAELTAPCDAGYNGANYGAIEPVVLPLKDGRVWMLMRTQTGRLYESFSRDGVAWSAARPSAFYSSTSPAFLLRLPDRRIVLFWNNCQMPPRVDGQGVYGGRDVLHGAISDDEGGTWRGFREVYRDATRNESPPRSGDRGTAYPWATAMPDGRVALVSGQGAERRKLVVVDPAWLLATSQVDDFSGGLDDWSVFTAYGPASGYWRARTQGARLVELPGGEGKALQLARRENLDADGAAWNFPTGRGGRLTLRLQFPPGSAGGRVSLADRFFDPTDDAGEREALFSLPLDLAGGDGALKLIPGRWHALRLDWDLPAARCRAQVDDGPPRTLRTPVKASAGACYLRLRSTAPGADPAGMLVQRVNVEVRP